MKKKSKKKHRPSKLTNQRTLSFSQELAQSLSIALKHHQSGNLREAETVYKQILQKDPNHADALHLLGVIASQFKKNDIAIDLINKAILINPCMHQFHSNLGIVLKRSGRFNEAIEHYREAIRLKPDNAESHNILGGLFENQGKFDDAIEHYQCALQLKLDYVEVYNNLANLLKNQGKLDKAVENYQKALKCNPGFAELHYNFGKALYDLGRFDEAIEQYKQTLHLDPNNSDAHNNLGNVFEEQGKLDEAIKHYKQAIHFAPDCAEAYNNIGNILKDLGSLEESIKCYQQAIRIKPDFIEFHNNLGNIFREQGKLEKAIEHYKHTLHLDPDNLDAIAGEADVLLAKGEPEKAYLHILPYINQEINSIKMALVYASISDNIDKQNEAIELLESICSKNLSNRIDRSIIHFKLGKLYDEINQYDKAFSHYQQANTINQTHFDAGRHYKYISNLISSFSPNNIERLPRSTNGSQFPIFIIGMPRSGTSLIEQVLASHSQIFGAGEIDYIGKIAHDLPHALNTETPYPLCINSITQENLDFFSQQYLKHLTTFSSDVLRITDKMPHNFLHLGLIFLMFPDASIIHCIRNPLDTCLSIFFQNFSGKHSYACDLTNVGTYYKQYQKLMSHWREELHIPMLEVNYEDMVSEHEKISRKIIKYVGLEWDKACLHFHETKRLVNTASNQQVRKPIYTKSVKRWKNYERYICPLIDTLRS